MSYSKDELIQRIVKLSRGSGGVVAVSENDWEVLATAYGGNPLIQEIAKRALYIRPIAQFPAEPTAGDIIFKD